MLRKKQPIKHVLVCSAHSDDFVLGAGGTIAEYKKKGIKVHVMIFSYGEQSHPWLKVAEVKKMRAKETHDAAKVLGCSVQFFDLLEFKFTQGIKSQKIEQKITNFIKSKKPIKVFTHSNEDPHPDHKAVNIITQNVFETLNESQKPDLFVYSVWNPVEFKTTLPALKIDVSNTFSLKVDALNKFPSQKFHILYPRFMIYYRAIVEGIRMRKRYVEKFYRID